MLSWLQSVKIEYTYKTLIGKPLIKFWTQILVITRKVFLIFKSSVLTHKGLNYIRKHLGLVNPTIYRNKGL